jgi:SulP family sulfate permease
MGDLDYSGADTLRQVRNELDGRGTRMVLCSVDPAVRRLLDAFGLTEQIGAANIFATLQEAVDAYPRADGAPTEAPAPRPAQG